MVHKVIISGRMITEDLHDEGITKKRAIQRMGEIGGNLRESIIHFILNTDFHVEILGVSKKGWHVIVRCNSEDGSKALRTRLREKYIKALEMGILKIEIQGPQGMQIDPDDMRLGVARAYNRLIRNLKGDISDGALETRVEDFIEDVNDLRSSIGLLLCAYGEGAMENLSNSISLDILNG